MNNMDSLKDIMAESGAIASLIYHPEYYTIDNILTPTFFYDKVNQCLFWGIEQLIQSGVTNIDAINLGNILNSNESVKRVLKAYNLEDISKYINMAKHAARDSFEEYKLMVNNIITLGYKREILKFSSGIQSNCLNPDNSLDDINNYVSSNFDEINKKYLFCGDSTMFGERVDSLWESLCERRNSDGTFGIRNVVPELDNYMTLGRGELVLLAGDTGRGKSAYFLCQATHAVKAGECVMIIDTELTDSVFFLRILANVSGVPVHIIKSGMYTKDEQTRIEQAREWLKSKPFIHEYMPTFNKFKIEQLVKKWKTQKNLGLFIYDYIKPGSTYGAAETSQSLGLITDFIKGLAGKYDIATMAGLQRNKATGQVADSQKPERYGDVMMYWIPKTSEEIRRDGESCGNFKMVITKNRNGSLTDIDDYIDVSFQGDYMKVGSASRHTNDEPFEN